MRRLLPLFQVLNPQILLENLKKIRTNDSWKGKQFHLNLYISIWSIQSG